MTETYRHTLQSTHDDICYHINTDCRIQTYHNHTTPFTSIWNPLTTTLPSMMITTIQCDERYDPTIGATLWSVTPFANYDGDTMCVTYENVTICVTCDNAMTCTTCAYIATLATYVNAPSPRRIVQDLFLKLLLTSNQHDFTTTSFRKIPLPIRSTTMTIWRIYPYTFWSRRSQPFPSTTWHIRQWFYQLRPSRQCANHDTVLAKTST